MKKSRQELIEEILPLCIKMGDTMFTLVLRETGKVYDLTISQLKVLKTVEFKGMVKMKDISEKLSIRPSAATYTVDSLIKEKLLERYRCEDDRRVVLIKITEKGKKVVDDIREIKGKVWRKILLQLDEEEVKDFLTIFKNTHKIIDKIRKNENLFL